jgi:non-homologous end joining protein Ku
VRGRISRERAEPWDPPKYRDEYRDELRTFIKKRAKQGEKVIDIMDQLKCSLERTAHGGRRGRRRRAG